MSKLSPAHCLGCKHLHNAGHKNPTVGLQKYNAWCCANGKPAQKSIGHCKLFGQRKELP